MAIAFINPVKLAMIVIGLALISSGCASMHPSTTSSVPPPITTRQAVNAQQQAVPSTELAMQQKNPIEQSVYIANGLVQIGNYLVDGK
jgi:type IV pilus biogenesis protein CpaD/CtpE